MNKYLEEADRLAYEAGEERCERDRCERKTQLLARASEFHRVGVFLPGNTEYILAMKNKPEATTDYNQDPEPVVDADGLYDLDKSWLTVNRYNALVLNTRNLFIADIDFGDARLDKHAGVKDCDEVVANIEDLARLDAAHDFTFALRDDKQDFAFAAQSYKVYRTAAGCRVICTSTPIEWGWEASCLLRFLRSDPQYIALCEKQQCYRARLTPKPWRDHDDGLASVCVTWKTMGPVSPELRQQVRLHDELTHRNHELAYLA